MVAVTVGVVAVGQAGDGLLPELAEEQQQLGIGPFVGELAYGGGDTLRVLDLRRCPDFAPKLAPCL